MDSEKARTTWSRSDHRSIQPQLKAPAFEKDAKGWATRLSDFFNFGGSASTFTPFTQGVNYRTQCFLTPSVEDCFGASFAPADPDDDAVE